MLKNLLLVFTIVLSGTGTGYAQQSPAPDFVADYMFKGSELNKWQPIGQATWRAEHGIISGSADAGNGWLVFDESYQDAAIYSRFRCTALCDVGILLRAEKTTEGMQGILISLAEGTATPYRIKIDNNGHITDKEIARDPEARFRMSPWAIPVQVEPDKWNHIEIFIKGNEIQNHLNNIRRALQGGIAKPLPATPAQGPADVLQDGYGPIALYVGSGNVQFDNFGVKDLNLHVIASEQSSSRFRVQQVAEFAYAWGADVADINRDDINDLIAGPFYYLGPDFQTRREYYPVLTYNPGTEYVQNMLTYADDWTGDGWKDILITEMRPLTMYVNPKGENRRWDRVAVLPDVCSEIAHRGDVDSDGKDEIIYIAGDGSIAYGEPDPDKPNGPWIVRKISEIISSGTGSGCSAHGLGIGDVNGDGRVDILQTNGWWEQPATNQSENLWTRHEAVFGRPPNPYGGGAISVYDFNNDGLNDVIASLEAHGWGLAWYEQERSANGDISFKRHMIMDSFATQNAGDVTFSQLHAGAVLADIDQDGVMDFVTGKRHWAHLDSFTDADPNGEAVVYWYKTIRNPDAPGGVEFKPELIHNKSGVGSEMKAVDINNDGAIDIITAGSHGTFVFWGIPGAQN